MQKSVLFLYILFAHITQGFFYQVLRYVDVKIMFSRIDFSQYGLNAAANISQTSFEYGHEKFKRVPDWVTSCILYAFVFNRNQKPYLLCLLKDLLNDKSINQLNPLTIGVLHSGHINKVVLHLTFFVSLFAELWIKCLGNTPAVTYFKRSFNSRSKINYSSVIYSNLLHIFRSHNERVEEGGLATTGIPDEQNNIPAVLTGQVIKGTLKNIYQSSQVCFHEIYFVDCVAGVRLTYLILVIVIQTISFTCVVESLNMLFLQEIKYFVFVCK